MKRSILFVLVLSFGLATELANADFTLGEPVNLKSIIPVITPPDSFDCVSFDGLEMYITSGQGHDNNLRMLRRASKDEDWGPVEYLGPGVNSPSPYDDSTLSISADGLTLYFHSIRPGGYGSTDIYMTTRATKKDSWGPPVKLDSKVNSSVGESCPWISGDGLELHFHSKRSGGSGALDIWVTRRAITNDLWAEPVNLGPMVNGPGTDVGPHISPDGSTLYFTTYEPDTWTSENWQAPINPIVDLNGDGIVDAADMSSLSWVRYLSLLSNRIHPPGINGNRSTVSLFQSSSARQNSNHLRLVSHQLSEPAAWKSSASGL